MTRRTVTSKPKVHVVLSAEQHRRLSEMAQETQVPLVRIVRHAIDRELSLFFRENGTSDTLRGISFTEEREPLEVA